MPARTAKLKEKLADLPPKPGCYLFKNAAGTVLYVGKAVNLRNRVRSYFQKSSRLAPKVRRMVAEVRDLETILTEGELEALVLECNLIKRHRPQFNVRLRDDKHYPYLCLTTSDRYPRLLMTRSIRSDGNRYFGPYTSNRAVFAMMDLVKRIFPIVTCGKRYDGRPVRKPCLYYHMGRCPAPCAGETPEMREEYARSVKAVVAFLSGKQERIVTDLRQEMAEAADALRFERAAKLRDQIMAVEQVLERQKVISSRMVDQDVIAFVGHDGDAAIQMFYIRGGKLVGQNHFMLDGAGTTSHEARSADPSSPSDPSEGPEQSEAVQEFVKQYYQSAVEVPQEVILPCDIDETAIVESWLRHRRGSKVEITVPVRGDKRRLVEMAQENAANALEQLKAEMRARLSSADRALRELAEALRLPEPPVRIECFDISNFQSDAFVGSMVVCEAGEMVKSEYRRFRIRMALDHPDDPRMMGEVIGRRLSASLEGDPKFSRLPDLIIVDGGRSQVGAAVAAMEELGLTLPVCGLAKRFEVLIVPDEQEPLALSRDSQALYLVQRIRDEAHRFANAYRAIVQGKKHTRSALHEVPGIGPKRARALMRRFGSVARIREASLEDLVGAEGMTRPAAQALQAFFRAADDK
ncbi:MAG: excinuclease ABC subunit UvrC [Armatimonadetes bacterium]|nr:excinuclease ABC subunit UvrC [Armatimonadota bacterium]